MRKLVIIVVSALVALAAMASPAYAGGASSAENAVETRVFLRLGYNTVSAYCYRAGYRYYYCEWESDSTNFRGYYGSARVRYSRVRITGIHRIW